MGVPSASPPLLGSVGTGELLADAQTKTLWVGVPTSVDPAGSILVSDITGLLQEIAAGDAAVAAATATSLAGKSPVGHHHAISDVDGLTAALAATQASIPQGGIILWHGILADIPSGWALCNGSNGTPDLRDRMVLGAGGLRDTLSVGGSINLVSGLAVNGGTHTHTVTVTGTVLTEAQLPAHNHDITDTGHTHTITDPGHHHDVKRASIAAAGAQQVANPVGNVSAMQSENATTGITIASGTTGITIKDAGGGAAHTHTGSTADSGGAHSHTVTGTVLNPFVVLGYIMKL